MLFRKFLDTVTMEINSAIRTRIRFLISINCSSFITLLLLCQIAFQFNKKLDWFSNLFVKWPSLC